MHPADAARLDLRGLEALRISVRHDPASALRGAAREFEAMFLERLLAQMREAGGGGLFEGEHTRLYASLFDQQIARALAGRGMGLADVLVKSLERQTSAAAPPAAASSPAPTRAGDPTFEPAVMFAGAVWPHVAAASRETGIPARFLLAHAALESGWGRHEPRGADGTRSFNLLGIKATRGWRGRVVEAQTTEFVGGERRTVVERFRAYGSYAEAFRDYARLLAGDPRYREVLASGDDAGRFARALAASGYATDPMYAQKLQRILNSRALQQALARAA